MRGLTEEERAVLVDLVRLSEIDEEPPEWQVPVLVQLFEDGRVSVVSDDHWDVYHINDLGRLALRCCVAESA